MKTLIHDSKKCGRRRISVGIPSSQTLVTFLLLNYKPSLTRVPETFVERKLMTQRIHFESSLQMKGPSFENWVSVGYKRWITKRKGTMKNEGNNMADGMNMSLSLPLTE